MVQDVGAEVATGRPQPGGGIVVIQPHFRQGGAESVAAWTIQAGKDLAPVTVLTFDRADAAILNDRFGTNLQVGDFRALTLGFPFSSRSIGQRWTLMKLHWLMRRCKRWPDKRVLFFSASSEMDFGQPGVQYTNFPQFAERATREMRFFTPQDWYQRPSWFRRAYLGAGRAVSGFSENGIKANLTLTVSDWTGRIVETVYRIPTKTVYPPVTLEFPRVPLKDRERGFVCVGRIVVSKRVLEMIAILRAVRERGFGVHLHIIGPPGNSRYMRKVFAAQKQHKDWVSVEGPVTRASLAEMLARHRFGIHGMENEPFGIAVAEMAKAGCIVFVPDSGGQVEIVERDERLVYGSRNEAVDKITSVLADERTQDTISSEMVARGSRFSAERFVKEIKGIIDEAL